MISIAAPAFNEGETIESTVMGWIHFLDKSNLFPRWEIVICNDGSTDNTFEVLSRIKDHYPKMVNIIDLKKNVGAAAALTTAIKHCEGDWILINDSDGQFPIENLELLWKHVSSNNCTGAKGARIQKKDNIFMVIGSLLSGRILNLFYKTKYVDFNSAFMLIRSNILQDITLEAKGLNYSTEITGKLAERNICLHELPIEQNERPPETVSSKKLIRSAFERLTFVTYLVIRYYLIKWKVIIVK